MPEEVLAVIVGNRSESHYAFGNVAALENPGKEEFPLRHNLIGERMISPNCFRSAG
jgi:hypothetical protein